MGQAECFEEVGGPVEQLPTLQFPMRLRSANMQEDLMETNKKPSHLTNRTTYSKRLGDYQEGQYVQLRPLIAQQIIDKLNHLESIELECYRRLKGQRGLVQANKYFRYFRTGIIYEGEWLNGKPHGFGRNYYPSGGFYEGTFIFGTPHGFGRFINANGHYYQGEVKYGRGNGEGFYLADNILFKGEFKDNLIHGEGEEKGPQHYFKGVYQYGAKKKGVFKYSSNIYQGDFENDAFEGEGILTTEEGRYEGHFHNGLQHGYGQFSWKNGSKYRGHYVRGVRQGDGQFYNGDTKSICKGIWKNGLLQGEGIYQQPRGNVNKVIWNQSKIVALR